MRRQTPPWVLTMTCLLLAGPTWAQLFFTEVTDPPLTQFAPRSGASSAGSTDARNLLFFDYNNDGFQDVFLTENFGPGKGRLRIVLLHNTGDGRFVDQTSLIPPDLHDANPLAGSIAADYDNDGDDDLWLPVVNTLLRNDRGRFVATDARVGLDFADSGLWLDYDRDGHLDLLVSSYTRFTRDQMPSSTILLRNEGDGTFSDQTEAAGLDSVEIMGATGEGGMAAADFSNDGYPDLYLGRQLLSNRLFLNDGAGAFGETTTPVIGDEGRALDVAVGDIDNDGDLDIFQAAGGTVDSEAAGEDASLMLLNLGDGSFLNVANGAGLGLEAVGSFALGSAFADIDNDADLDLILTTYDARKNPYLQPRLFLNDGHGVFSDQSDRFGIEESGSSTTTGDFDEDGSIDILISHSFRPESAPGERNVTSLYRNNGNTNHWLRVELVGTGSNRNGIGARLTANTGGLSQTREVLGGLGRVEHERIAHFGLGDATQVDALEIRWPSGLVDTVTAIPADQKIRIIEGQDRWVPAPRTVWELRPPNHLESGSEVTVSAIVRPALFEPTAAITSIAADLSSLGGPQDVPLQDLGDGRYQLVRQLTVTDKAGHSPVDVLILQETSLGEHWIRLTHDVTVEDGQMTAILESRDETTPAAFTLSQNYPNPFNPETTIRFELPTAGEAELSLYNLTGQRVATLISGFREAGSYAVVWDGRDDAGEELASGMYLYRLRAGGKIQTRKLLLLR